MKIVKQVRGNILIFYIGGKINNNRAAPFYKTVEGYIGGKYTHIFIDLRDVTFIDSDALEGLILLNDIFKKSSVKLIFTGPREQIRGLFRDRSIDQKLNLLNVQN